MTKPEKILFEALKNLIDEYGEGNVPRETLDKMWETYPRHLWEGLRDKNILTKENEICYIDVSRET